MTGPVPEVVAATAYFTVAEALTNAAKHSLASSCSVRARSDGDRLQVTVDDDGVGGADPDGSGLRGLADRVEAIGGRLRLDGPPGRGTRLTVVLPLASRAPAPRSAAEPAGALRPPVESRSAGP